MSKFAENIKKLKETGSMGDYQSEEAKQARATVASKKKTPAAAAPKRSDVGLDVGKKPAATVKKGQDVISDEMSFGKAFRAARNEGMGTFTWRGKKYGTKMKKKEASKPAPAPKDPQPTASKMNQEQAKRQVLRTKRASAAMGKLEREIADLEKRDKSFFRLSATDANRLRMLKSRLKLAQGRGSKKPLEQNTTTSEKVKEKNALQEQIAKLQKFIDTPLKSAGEAPKLSTARSKLAKLKSQLKKMS